MPIKPFPCKYTENRIVELTNGEPTALRPDFDRLLEQDFAHLVAGHGVMLRDGAKQAIARSCRVQGVRDR